MNFIGSYKKLVYCLKRDQNGGAIGSSWFFIRSLKNPMYSVIYTYRIGTFLYNYRRILFPLYLMFCFIHRWNVYKTGIQLEFGTKIGYGLTFAHMGAIIINPQACIGENCLIYQGVTIGSQRGGQKSGAPKIGNNCILSSGSKIIGGVTIGDNVVIGANAVVTKDIPSGSVAVGIPARVIRNDAIETIKQYISI